MTDRTHSKALLPDIPADLRQLMAEVGPRWRDSVAKNVDLMIERFSEVLKRSPRDGVTAHAGITYGDHERHAFDVFLPETMTTTKPVVLFAHGGAFVSGHRNRSEQIYSNVLYYLARHGIAGINIGYRLANHATFPAATEDIAAVVAWAHEHAADYGWDPARIFLMGHSAGAAHAGSYAYDPRFRPADGTKLAGMIVVSCRVRIDNLPENPNAGKVEVYYGPDASKFDDYSPVAHIDKHSIPTFVAWSEFENPLIDVYCAELVYRLAHAKRKAPPSMWLSGHNHTSSIGQIGTSDDALGQAIVDFVRNPR
jgi:acetyl esterase/lipase